MSSESDIRIERKMQHKCLHLNPIMHYGGYVSSPRACQWRKLCADMIHKREALSLPLSQGAAPALVGANVGAKAGFPLMNLSCMIYPCGCFYKPTHLYLLLSLFL